MRRIPAAPLVALGALATAARPVPAVEFEGFTRYGGAWELRDGSVIAQAAPGSKLVRDDPAFADGEAGVELRLTGDAPGNAGLIVRVSEPGEGADRFSGYEVSLDVRRRVLRLGRHRQDFRLLRDVPCDVAADRWIALTVAVTGRTIRVRVDGRAVLEYEDDDRAPVAGRVGLRPWQRPAEFRNLWIESGGPRTAVAFRAAGVPEPPAFDPERLPPIAFVTRQPLSAPPAVGQDLWAAEPRGPGCGIRVLDPARPDLPPREIFSDPAGCIYDLNVSFDARTLYFSRRREGERHWHIWRVGADGTGLAQLTDGPFYDVGPCELPDGRLVFVSTRRFGYTLCQPGPASNLHVMDPDGGNLRCVSMNTLSDFSPQVLPDGRVLFTRWEYIDRDLTYRQSLWTQYPDGTAYQLYFGNTVRDVGTFWQARPLPGRSDRVVATFAPHHGFPHGAIGLIDRAGGPEGAKGGAFAYLTREIESVGDARQEWGWRDPFPVTADVFLCSGGTEARRFRLYLLDVQGRRRVLYDDPAVSCFFPIALRAVPVPPRLPGRVEPAAAAPRGGADRPTGEVLLADVYRGLEPTVARGRVKSIRVMEQVRKTEDLAVRAYDQSPVMGYGTYYVKRCWGTVPVESDGSARFLVPALREVYFQALDAEGRELQRMTSAVQLMPGERVGCIGCHEPRQGAPPHAGSRPLAAGHAPIDPVPPAWARDGIVDFPGVVQPVLDRHCVRCHDGPAPAGGCNLSADRTRFFSMAYDNLLGRSRSYRQHDMETGVLPPQEVAKGKPLVHFFWLLRTPTAVNLPLTAGAHASRLADRLESGHGGADVPREALERIYAWIDADVPYYGTYAHARPSSPGRRDRWSDPATGRPAAWFADDVGGVYRRRCAGCHGDLAGTTDWEGRFAWIDLTRPAHSPALVAHLPAGSGGRGLPATRDGREQPPFTGTGDPDYQTMLRAIERGREMALATPEADMPGFAGGRPEP